MTLTTEPTVPAPRGDRMAEADLGAPPAVASAMARSMLERWAMVVRSVLLTSAAADDRTALRGLVAWYERMLIDPDYDNPAPGEGVAALIALSGERSSSLDRRVVVTYRAVRLAEELGACRAKWSSHGSDPGAHRVALAKLDLALQVASEPLRSDHSEHDPVGFVTHEARS